jgi:FkbM family methyltransferase
MPRQSFEYAELDRELFSVLKRLGYEPNAIYDVGASNGIWSAEIAKVFPRASFHLFEPLIDHVLSYRSAMSHHLQQHPTFRLHKLALGRESGEIAINIPPDPVGSTILDVDR